MKFIAYNPFVKQQRTDKGFKVEFEVSEDQYNVIKELPLMQDQELEITIKQKDG